MYRKVGLCPWSLTFLVCVLVSCNLTVGANICNREKRLIDYEMKEQIGAFSWLVFLFTANDYHGNLWRLLEHYSTDLTPRLITYGGTYYIDHRPLVSIQLCLTLPPPSSSSCTCILLFTFLSPDLFSKYSLVALFLCGLVVSTVAPVWWCCRYFFLTCVQAIANYISLYCDVYTEGGRSMFIFSLIMMLMKTRWYHFAIFDSRVN